MTDGRSAAPDPSGGRRSAPALTIGEVESLTGLPAATLRSWEQRFGFPVPERSAGGQRRYSPDQVEQVRRVQAERSRGLGLAAAVARVTGTDVPRSAFSDLRETHPHLDVMTVGVRVMNALTFAIEDECLAHARRPVLLGCFQTQGSFRRAGRRWRELGRRAERAVVLSDFDRTLAEGAPEQAALAPDSPLLNEWGLVCVDTDLSVVLVGWERPRTSPAVPRVFEAVVSIEPDVVRDAAARYARAARDAGLPETDRLVPAASAEADPHRTMSLLRRFATYSDA